MKQRLHFLDALRGFTLINMIAFHGMWNLVYLFGVRANWYTGMPGYLWQQWICWTFILLSGFCLFLPYAKEMVYGTETVTAKEFYIKRIARIFPSYFLCIAICLFCFALPLNEYSGSGFMVKDLLAKIFFVSRYRNSRSLPFFPQGK